MIASTAPAADSVWPIIDLLDEIGTSLTRSPSTADDAEAFHLVVLRRAGAVGIDVVDVGGREPGIRDGVVHAADDRLAVRARPGAVEAVGKLAAAGDHAADPRAARDRGVVAFQHQGAGAFGHDEAVAVLGKRLRRGLRRVVLDRQGREERKADQALRIDRAVGRNAQRGVGFAAPDRLDAELDRARARGAGGRERNRRALGAELLRQPFADRAEQEAL